MSGPSKTPNNPRISAFQSFAPTTTVSTVRKVKQPLKDEPMASSSSSSSEEAKAPIRLQALPPRQELGKLMVVRSRKPRLSPPPSPRISEHHSSEGVAPSESIGHRGLKYVAAANYAPQLPYGPAGGASSVAGSDYRGIGAIGGVPDALGAILASFASMSNPLLSQVLLTANKPHFLGTVANFPEFCRTWGEYLGLIRTLQPGIQEAQVLALFKGCLDKTSATQLQRKIEKDPTITTVEYLRIMEKTFGQDSSGQARQAWKNVRLNVKGGALDWGTWRDFREQFELAGDRVEDKSEKEEFDLLYQQLPIFWQEKIVRDAQRRPEGRHWLKISAIPGLTSDCVEDLLKGSGIAFRKVKDSQSGFSIQCYDEQGEDAVLRLDGGTIDGHRIKIVRTRMQLEPSDIFRTIDEHLRSTEEAEAIRISLGGSRRVTAVEKGESKRESRDSPRHLVQNPLTWSSSSSHS